MKRETFRCLLFLLVLSGVAVFVAAPSSYAGEPNYKVKPSEAAAESPPEKETPAVEAPPSPPKGENRVVFRFEEPEDEEMREVLELLKRSKVIEDLVAEVNDNIQLPPGGPITVVIKESADDEGPYYDEQGQEIGLDYQFMVELLELLEDHEITEDRAEAEEALLNLVEYVFLHEIGHALIDRLEIPIVGKEEDAVDAFAMVVLSLGDDERGQEIALTAAAMHAVLADERGELEEEDFWDEHSLDEQRFAKLVCWTYGSDPENNEDLVSDGLIPEDIAERCPEEFEQKVESWLKLLEPHLKK